MFRFCFTSENIKWKVKMGDTPPLCDFGRGRGHAEVTTNRTQFKSNSNDSVYFNQNSNGNLDCVIRKFVNAYLLDG